MNLEQAVTMAGGRADAIPLPSVIPKDQYKSVQATLMYASALFNKMYRVTGPIEAGKVHLVLTGSTSLDCRSRQLDNQDAVVLAPIGMIARLRVMSRLLLRYWDKERRILPLGPARDPVPESTWRLPRMLEPLFDDEAAQDWDRLAALDRSLDLAPSFEDDVQELMHLAITLLLSHEFAHLVRRHSEFLRCARQRDPRLGSDVLSLTKDEIRRALEIDADVWGANLSLGILMGLLSASNSTDRAPLGFLRLAYAITMVFGMYDVRRKYIGAYDHASYVHPVVRIELSNDAINTTLAGSQLRDVWRQSGNMGWQRCVFAFADLNLDGHDGLFGEGGFGPISVLNYTPPWRLDDPAAEQLVAAKLALIRISPALEVIAAER